MIQAKIAQLGAYRLGTMEIPGSNPGKGENFSVKINIYSSSFEAIRSGRSQVTRYKCTMIKQDRFETCFKDCSKV